MISSGMTYAKFTGNIRGRRLDGIDTCDILPYRQISNIRRTKYQNLNLSRLVLHLFLHTPLDQCVK